MEFFQGKIAQTDMKKHLLLAILSAYLVVSLAETKYVRNSFRKAGIFSARFCYARIHTWLNFATLKAAHESLCQLAALAAERSSNAEGTDLANHADFYVAVHLKLAASGEEIDRLQGLFGVESGSSLPSLSAHGGAERPEALVPDPTVGQESIAFLSEELRRRELSDVHLEEATAELRRILENECSPDNITRASSGERLLALSLADTVTLTSLELGRAAETLLTGALSPGLASRAGLSRSLASIKRKAGTLDLSPVHKNVGALYKAPLSVFLDGQDGRVRLVLHVPLVEAHPLELFEFLPAPTVLESKNLTVTIVPPHALTYLATSRQARGPRLGKEFTAGDLAACRVEWLAAGRIFLCPESGKELYDVGPTCLGGLLFGNWPTVQSECRHLLSDAGQDPPGQTVPPSELISQPLAVEEADWLGGIGMAEVREPSQALLELQTHDPSSGWPAGSQTPGLAIALAMGGTSLAISLVLLITLLASSNGRGPWA